MSTQIVSILPDSKELVRQATDIASLCRAIVIASSVVIQGRKYVRVEGWQSIATAHGCVASARDVRKVEGGMVATGEIRRMQDGILIATAEGFVGEDEPTWYGGQSNGKTLPKRAEYAIRAMAQTRAISRACRGCFAHVVVLMNAGLSTTPAEEVPEGGFNDAPQPEPEHKITPEAEHAKRLAGRTKAALADKPADIADALWMQAYAAEGCRACKLPEFKSLPAMNLAELKELSMHHAEIIAAMKAELQPA